MELIRIGSKNDIKTVTDQKISHYCARSVLVSLKKGLSWWLWCGMQLEVRGGSKKRWLVALEPLEADKV